MKKYMVMECHVSYAVVLDEEGRFLKVANRQYEVGQTVTDIIEMQVPQSVPQKTGKKKWLYSLVAMAACMVLVVTSIFYTGQMAYASVYMSINPEVRIDVNRKDIVVGLEGINPDGNALIDGYQYKHKELNLLMDELVDRAIEQGYLHEGGQISLVLDADSEEWLISHGDSLGSHLNEHLNPKLSVTVEVSNKGEENSPIVIPVQGDSDYGLSDYEESDYGESDYEDSDYEEVPMEQPPMSSPDSDYADSDYGGNDYADSDYGISDYDQSDESDDADSDYDEESSISDYYDSDDDSDEEESDYNDSDDDMSDYESDDD